ncbi:hypothetical protein RYX36_024434 [Vicia faba]
MNIHQENSQNSSVKKFFERAARWFEFGDRERRIKDMKTSMGIAVSIIATITFSLATNPPGGVVQAGVKDIPVSINDTFCSYTTGGVICVGESILATSKSGDYLAFLISNTICFISSLSVLLLLVSGIPITKTFILWLLSVGMCVILTTFALTYMFAVFMVTPDVIWQSHFGVLGIAIIVWVSLVGILAFILTLRLIVRAVNKVYNFMECQETSQ